MGESMPGYEALHDNLGQGHIWYPFQSQHDWEFARWAKNRGPSLTAVTELLRINGVVESLGLSYHNGKELNRIINEEMPADQSSSVRRFSKDLIFVLEHHYHDAGHTVQVFSEMYTGKWWWSVQQSLESCKPGTTVISIVISSDKTQLTLFRSKSAYPIYMTIGNIPKAICNKLTQQAQMLMGYIPTAQLKQIKNKAAQCRVLANIFHSCMQKVLSPIESYSKTGRDWQG
ncbi:hypothetical protein V8E53_000724 [Lactarius tabidus]